MTTTALDHTCTGDRRGLSIAQATDLCPACQVRRDPQAAAQALLAATPVEELLTKAYALTHRIHECRGSQVAGQCDGPCTDQRAQRDLITAEVLRRTGGQ